jgi:hypothetical protein
VLLGLPQCNSVYSVVDLRVTVIEVVAGNLREKNFVKIFSKKCKFPPSSYVFYIGDCFSSFSMVGCVWAWGNYGNG